MLFGAAGPAGVPVPLGASIASPGRRASSRRGCRGWSTCAREHNAHVFSVSNLPTEQVTFACLNVYDRSTIKRTILSSASATVEWTSSVSPKRDTTQTARVSGVYVPAASTSSTDHTRVSVSTCQLTTAASLSSLATASPRRLSL